MFDRIKMRLICRSEVKVRSGRLFVPYSMSVDRSRTEIVDHSVIIMGRIVDNASRILLSLP